MNNIADEIMSYYGIGGIEDDENSLEHYGIKRRSGRYPYGSGDDPYQRTQDFLGRYETYKKQGLSEKEIAAEMGIFGEDGVTPSTGRLRIEHRVAKNERRMLDVARAKSLSEDGKTPTEIGREMGVNESTVRGWLEKKSEVRMSQGKSTAEFLKARMKETGKFLDVGADTNRELNVSPQAMDEALYLLKREGYEVYKGGIPQATNPGKQTNQRVLCPPGTEHKEIYNFDNITTVKDYISRDGGETYDKVVYPKSMDSKRLMIRYKDDVGPDGARGVDKDGVIELRRGVEDISLGNDRYSQVRILVDGTHYLKGMAVYSDNMPDGVDVIFNTNKGPDKAMKDVLKPIKNDPDNPFGALIKAGGQSTYTDANGQKQMRVINKTKEEGDWSEWADSLPSQFLSKQPMSLIKKQLNLAKADKYAEYESICEINNPTIKKHLLQKFADDCDGAAVHLKAAALPGQKYHVIMPINALKDTEVYAPKYENGTKLALVRYPHGGLFEIPILTVNNKNKIARSLLPPDADDAIGITSKVAEQLSGADFDGDTVMCIPTHDPGGKVKIASKPPLAGLVGFDPKAEYPEVPGMRYMKDEKRKVDNTQSEMGRISNLITDMTLAGATDDELTRAVRHSMVVIDAGKHKLNYKQSEMDNNIAALERKYQAKLDKNGNIRYGGAATLISRAKGQESAIKTQGSPKINIKGSKDYDPSKPEGALLYKVADDAYYPIRTWDKTTGYVTIKTTDRKKITYNPKDPVEAKKYDPIKRVDEKTGKVSFTNEDGSISYQFDTRTEKSTKMAETDDAYTLLSVRRDAKEIVYADYANSMKALANQARKEMVSTGKIEYSASAKAVYAKEVKDLNDKLNDALLNTPREREAQRRANSIVSKKIEENPDMDKKEIKKQRQQALSNSRIDVGAIARRYRNIEITDREWEAIQAGAVSESTLTKILNNTDIDKLRERATPRTTTSLSTAQISRIKNLRNSNYTIDEIAKKMNKSPSVISKYLKGES